MPDNEGMHPMMMVNPEELREMQQQMAAARQQEAAAQKLSNEHLSNLSPEEVVARLKGVLYRVAPILKLTELIQMDFGSEVLAASLRSSVGALVDAVKWIAWHSDQDPFAKYGDDTLLVMARDVLLGDDLGRTSKQAASTVAAAVESEIIRGVLSSTADDEDGDREL